jgi:hypothetical protein
MTLLLFYGSDDVQPAVGPNGTIAFAAEPQFGSSELRFVRRDGRIERRLTYHCVRLDENAGTAIYGTWLADVIDARNRFRDTVSCGAGRDVVSADRRDHVGRGREGRAPALMRPGAADRSTNRARRCRDRRA